MGQRIEHVHAARFYENDDRLADSIVDFLLDGWDPSESLVVVATENRRKAIESKLRERGVHAASVTMLDAAKTLDSFMVRGKPDVALFEKHVAKVIEKACEGARRARVYGEMVDILSREGEYESMIELEEMWVALASRHPFSLLCAYHRGNLFRERTAVDGVRRTHTHVADEEE